MKRIVVATGNRVAMGETVDDALAQLYGAPIAFASGVAPPAEQRAAQLEAVRGLQQRSQRLREEHTGVQEDLQRVLEALERSP